MLNITQRQTLQQKMTPQQVQYLQLLQLPVLALEQRIKAELEMNPLLEEGDDADTTKDQEEGAIEGEMTDLATGERIETKEESSQDDGYTFEDFMNDDLSGYKVGFSDRDNGEREEFPQPAEVTVTQRIVDQIHFLDLSPEEDLLSIEIIGSIDEDGYLRRELELIVQDVNMTHKVTVTMEQANEVLKKIQRLDPPGIAARTLQECLIAQLEVSDYPSDAKGIALRILEKYFDEFSLKHYEELSKKLNISIDRLKPIIEIIQKLNPKPGEGQFTAQQNYVIPDFTIEHVDDEFIVLLNDKNVPPLRINKGYKQLMARRMKNGIADDVKSFLRKRFESAKWFVASINQRRDTMLKVMRAIVGKQMEFFETGENLKPMIYKDIAEIIGMDISTISRVVNGKYVQTEYGVYELRHFFSDKITTATGEEISNKEVKKMIKEIIENENPEHPLSDDRIAEMLNNNHLNIARRTVAKYREAMKMPVARLRRKI